MNPAKPIADARNWGGQISNADPHDLPPGAMQAQQNMTPTVTGLLQVREGWVPATYVNAASATTNEIIAMALYQSPLADYLIYEDTAGNIKAGKSPS